jgi:hypothetical protein
LTAKQINLLVQFKGFLATERQQLVILIALSLGITALLVIAYSTDPLLFQRWLASINPMVVGVVIVVVGAGILTFFLWRGWFAVYASGQPKRFLWSAGIATLLAAMMIVADVIGPYPEDINVLWPQSLLYYPVIGYVVEILFHVLPLFLLLSVITFLSRTLSFDAIFWPCILIVSLLEPVFQARFEGDRPLWLIAYLVIHLFVFNVIQLGLFKRYDFVTMYSFRLTYYALWHVLWGQLRIPLLF